MNSKLLQYSLLFGCVYFICMSAAHFFSLKYPLLFVYYDVPFYAYQDRIISFALSGYVFLFYFASRSREAVPVVLLSLGMTVIGLSALNMSSVLEEVMTESQSTTPYWAQTILIAVYAVYLARLYRKEKR